MVPGQTARQHQQSFTGADVLRQAHLCAGQVKRLMRYAMHRAAERLTPAPQCTSTAAQPQGPSSPSTSHCDPQRGITSAGPHLKLASASSSGMQLPHTKKITAHSIG